MKKKSPDALGDPRRLARELRAETDCGAGKINCSLGNSATALLAIGGLAAVDILLMLQIFFAVTLAMLIICLVIFVLGIIGFGLSAEPVQDRVLCVDYRMTLRADRRASV